MPPRKATKPNADDLPLEATPDNPGETGDLVTGDGTGEVLPSAEEPEAEREAGDDVEAAEVVQIEAVAEAAAFDDPYFAVGDCRDTMLEIIKRAVPWSKMRESHQRDVIQVVSNAAVTIVQKIARAVASEGCESIGLTLEKLVVKDGLQLTLKGPYQHEAMLMLGDSQGKQVLISMPDSARFDHGRSVPQPDPDQPDMPLAGPEGDNDLVEAAEGIAQGGDGEADDAGGIPSNRVVGREGVDKLVVRHAETGAILGEPTDAERTEFLDREAADAERAEEMAQEA